MKIKTALITAFSAATTLSACSTPGESLKFAQDRCAYIGYDIERERVPTLQCTERKFDQHQAQGRAIVNGVTVGLITVAAGVAIQ